MAYREPPKRLDFGWAFLSILFISLIVFSHHPKFYQLQQEIFDLPPDTHLVFIPEVLPFASIIGFFLLLASVVILYCFAEETAEAFDEWKQRRKKRQQEPELLKAKK